MEKSNFIENTFFQKKRFTVLLQIKKIDKKYLTFIHHELSKTFTVKVALILSAAYQIPDLNSAAEKKDITQDTINIDDTSENPSD